MTIGFAVPSYISAIRQDGDIRANEAILVGPDMTGLR
jgi:hypothetical protein